MKAKFPLILSAACVMSASARQCSGPEMDAYLYKLNSAAQPVFEKYAAYRTFDEAEPFGRAHTNEGYQSVYAYRFDTHNSVYGNRPQKQ